MRLHTLPGLVFQALLLLVSALLLSFSQTEHATSEYFAQLTPTPSSQLYLPYLSRRHCGVGPLTAPRLEFVGQLDEPVKLNRIALGDKLYGVGYDNGLKMHAIDVSNPRHPIVTSSTVITPTADPNGDGGRTVLDFKLHDGYAYIIGLDFHVQPLSSLTNPAASLTRAPTMPFLGVVVQGQYAYVNFKRFPPSVGGLLTVDITDKSAPKIVTELVAASEDAPYHGIAVAGSYVLLAGDQLQMVNISEPTRPRVVNELGLGLVQDIVVDGPYAYLMRYQGVRYTGLSMVDISSPAALREVSDILLGGDGGEGGYGSGTDIHVQDCQLYLTTSSGLYVIDVSQPHRPRRLKYYSYPGGFRSVAMSSSHLYVVDDEGKLLIYEKKPE